MIPVLYSETETDFGHNGIGVLTYTLDYEVTEEANGEFELYLEYPADSQWASELKDQRLIKAKPNDMDPPHIFRIYEIIKNLNEQTIYIYATTRTNDLGGNLVLDVTVSSKTAQEAMNLIKNNLVEPTDFNLVSDIQTRSSTRWTRRNPLNCIVGEDDSLVKYWGGEVKRTNDTIYLYSRRGRDNVTVLRQGKNLEGFEMTVSTKGLITRILPYFSYFKDGDENPTTIVGSIVDSPLVNNYPIRSIIPVDYSDDESVTDLASLNNVAKGYFAYRNPDCDKPTVNTTIDLLQLADSAEYAKFKGLETIGLFDTVTVWVEKYNVDVTVKINRVVYNGLKEQVVRVVAGTPKGGLYSDIRQQYTQGISDLRKYVDTVENGIRNVIQMSADGSFKIFRGYTEPAIELANVDDIWYKELGNGEVEAYIFNGLSWDALITAGLNEATRLAVENALTEAAQAKTDAEQAYTDAVAEANRLVTAQTEAFDAEMAARQTEIAGVKTTADNTQASINQAVQNAGFTSLSQSLVDIKAIAKAAETDADQALLELQSKASTAALEAYNDAIEAELALKATATDLTAGLATKASTTALEAGLALKVATSTYNAKVSELNTLITAAQTKADTVATDLLKKADTTTMNTELAKKLATTTYNTKMTALDTAISGHGTRIKATEDGLALTATKVEVDDVRTRMTEAETEISQNSDAIALKASQSSLDTTNGKLATAEASLVVQAGQIASKVSQTDFNALSGRVGTAETTITQQAGQIALKASQLDLDAATDDISDVQASLTVQAGQITSKVSQTDFNALSGRVGTAETTISQQAGQIALKASQASLDTATQAISDNEAELVIQAGQIASKVAQTDFNALSGRVGTAESSISQQAGEIALRVTTSTYNAGIGSKENTITKANTAPAHLNGRLWLDTSVTPNVLKRSTGTAWVKVTPTTPGEVGAYSAGDGSALAGRISTAETSIVSNTTAIGLRATKSDLDSTNGRLSTAEGTLTVQAGQIASKVSQTDFDALDSRVDTAESSITQQAGEIALRVTTTTYNSGIASKENTVTKSSTAPSHLNGRLWLDTSTTPNVLKRSTGSAWVKATPTTAGEVGAYSATDGSALAGRVSTAETSIVSNTTAISLRANKTDLDATNGRLSTAEGTLTVQAGQIASKASQTDVNSLTGRVSTAESTITQQAGQISSRVTTTTYNAGMATKANGSDLTALAGRVGTAETTLTQQAGQISLRATKTEAQGYATSAVDAIAVGGPNLASIDSIVNYGTPAYVRDGYVYKLAGNSAGIAVARSVFTVGKEYVLTFKMRKKSGNIYVIGGHTGDFVELGLYIDGQRNTDWTFHNANAVYPNDTLEHTIRLHVRFVGDDADPGLYIQPNRNQYVHAYTADIYDLQVEEGNKHTPWKPPYADIQSDISKNSAELVVQAGQIASRVTQTTYNAGMATKANSSDLTALTGRVSSAETSITQQAGQIALKASQADVDYTYDIAIANEAAIAVQAGQINLRATKTEAQGYATSAVNALELDSRNLLTRASLVYEYGTFSRSSTERLSGSGNWFLSYGIDLVPGKSYTISNTHITNSSSIFDNGLQLKIWNAGITVEKLYMGNMHSGGSITFTAPANSAPGDRLLIYLSLEGWSEFDIWRLKLEKGTKATGYALAPEDISASISSVSSSLTVEAGKISALTTRVTNNETLTNSTYSTAEANKATISTQSGKISVLEQNVSGLQSTVADKADKSQITQLSTSISTKVESATYNSKMSQIDSAINLRVTAGDVTTAILNDKRVKDTRHDNQLPSWYFFTYPKQVVEEFKYRNVLGAPGGSEYGVLTTDVPWDDHSGGSITQTFKSGDGQYRRVSSTSSAWGAWVQIADSKNVLAQINLSTEGVLIQGKRIQLDGDVTMTAAFITNIKAKSLEAVNADITNLRAKILVTDVVTSTHLKSDTALIGKLFATDANIGILTAKTAFINSVKAIDISADRITAGTLNASNVNIINLNVSKLVGDRTAFVKSAWDSVSSSVTITSEGLVSNAASGAQALIQNGVLLVRGSDGISSGYIGFGQDSTNNNLQITIANGRSFQVRYSLTGGTFVDLIGYYSYLDQITLNKDTNIYGKLNMRNNFIENLDNIKFRPRTIIDGWTNNNLDFFSYDAFRYYLSGYQVLIMSRNYVNNTNNASMYAHLNMQGYNISGQSDRRLKKDIVNTQVRARELFRLFNFVEYAWLDENKPGGRHFGLIAQDTPFLSEQGSDGIWNINTSKQIMLNSLGIKELDTHVSQHELEIENLKKRITELEEMLA